MNLWSFICSFVCVGFFLLTAFSGPIQAFSNHSLHVHPFYIVLTMTILTLFFGVWGLSEVRGWKTFIRSAATLFLTLGLSVLIVVILIFANLFQFT